MKYAAYTVLGVIAFFALWAFLFGFSFANIRLGGILQAERAAVGREVYEETLSFNRGLQSNFERMRVELETSDGGSRRAVCASMLRQFAPDVQRLTPDQQDYYRRVQAEGC